MLSKLEKHQQFISKLFVNANFFSLLSLTVFLMLQPRTSVAQIIAEVSESAFEPTSAPFISSTPVWNISGFGTIGVVGQAGGKDLRLVRNSAQAGPSSRLSALPDSRLGLQLNWNPEGGWEGAVQGVWLPRPSDTPLGQYIESAYFGYRFGFNTRVWIGRTTPDIYLFVDSRNIGFALPWARPPVDFYGFAPLTSVDGISINQRWFSGEATWRARASAGTIDSSASVANGSSIGFKGHDTLAVGLTREEGSLQIKASYIYSRAKIRIDPALGQLRQRLIGLSALPVSGLAGQINPLLPNLWDGGKVNYLALAALYETGPWTLITEASHTRIPNSSLSAARAYVTAGYRQGMVTYYGTLSRVRPDRDAPGTPALADTLGPVIGEAGAQQAQALAGYAIMAGNDYRHDQQTVGIGLRWDFKPNAALKLQVDRFDVKRNGSAGWRYSDGRPGRGTLVSVLVDFVWGQ